MKFFIVLSIFTLLSGCSQIVLEPSDFAWPVETVLEIDKSGNVSEARYSFTTNVIPIFYAEKNDSSSFRNESIRIIRDSQGFYFFVANEFKNVYVFKAENGKLNLTNSILVTEFGLDLPAFNQRKPYIEVLDGEKHIVYLTPDGIKGEE